MKSRALNLRIAYLTLLIPFMFVVLTVLFGWFTQVRSSELILFTIMYLISTLGITAGYHRYMTHKSFKIHTWGGRLLLIAGSMAAQGPVLFWVSTHRLHHQKSDTEGDPHSPNNDQSSGRFKRFWYAHVGWMVKFHFDQWPKLVGDLLKNRMVVAVNMQYFFWLFMGIVIPGVINGLIHGSMSSFLTGILWGGLLRIFFVHHTTWSINSICHLFGSQDFATKDNSRNNFLLGLLTLGEGFHNNHHAFPYSARHGLKLWQIDLTYLFILFLKRLNIVWDVKLPKQEIVENKRITANERY